MTIANDLSSLDRLMVTVYCGPVTKKRKTCWNCGKRHYREHRCPRCVEAVDGEAKARWWASLFDPKRKVRFKGRRMVIAVRKGRNKRGT